MVLLSPDMIETKDNQMDFKIENLVVNFDYLDNINISEYQRDLKESWVNEIYDKQIISYKKYKTFIFPGSFEIVNFCNQNYIIDGQHRLKAYQKLKINYPEIKNNEIFVKIYNCGENKNKILSIYALCNEKNNENETSDYIKKFDPIFKKYEELQIKRKNIKLEIDKSKYLDKIRNDIINVCSIIKNKYNLQCSTNKSCNAPNFSSFKLEIELYNIYENKNINVNEKELVDKIIELNEKYKKYMESNLHNDTIKSRYYKCLGKSSFFLPYKSPHCRWVNELNIE